MSASVNEMERQIRVALIKIDEISGKYEEVALDVNMRDVTLCLWGIPDMTQAQKESEVK